MTQGKKSKFRFPIRFKILITLLVVVTGVVSMITFTMANLFHDDKTSYIRDLTSVIAVHTAEESGSYLGGYNEKLKVFTRMIFEKSLTQETKVALIQSLFKDFNEFVAVTVFQGEKELVTIFDAETLKKAGLKKEDFTRFRRENPLPMETILEGHVYIKNSTLSETMPTLTLAARQMVAGEKTPVVSAAIIRLDSLLRSAGRSKVFETFLIAPDGTLLAHTDKALVLQKARASWIPDLEGLFQNQSLATTLEYEQGETEMVGGFSRVNIGGLLAGVQVRKSAAYLTARNLLNNLIGTALILLIVSAILSLFWSRKVTRPIERLLSATRDVGKGRFNIKIESTTRDEIGDLAGSFNEMALELENREEALKQAQDALVQSEKMAAFGQLGAGIAHEVKNPLAGIQGYAQLTMRKLEKDHPIYKNLEIIEKETKRCKTIIENLMKFARQEKRSFDRVDINRVVDDSVAIVNHQLTINRVKLVKETTPGLPQVIGNANQFQQVLLNLMINAQQALNGKPGEVKVGTRLAENPENLEIWVSDSGPGIPPEIQAKIFEPFFTTKPAGKGTGLGLSVTYGIIKENNGDIRIESTLGEGATFVITLPKADEREMASTQPPEESGGKKGSYPLFSK